jgi:hypothetical protein
MRTEVYWVSGPWPGRLGIVPRPRGGDWLADEIRSWKDSQIDIVASLLTPEETAELDLLAEEALAREEGLPVPDTLEQRDWVVQNVSATAAARFHQD